MRLLGGDKRGGRRGMWVSGIPPGLAMTTRWCCRWRMLQYPHPVTTSAFFVDDAGERVHHILSPSTGRSVKGVQSVTIIGDDALTTDGLSTAVFVLGPEKGLKMVERLPAIDVVVIDDKRMMHVSEGLVPPPEP